MMIQIGDKIISTELFKNYFVCHLEECRGMCCVYGDAGAPLTDEETGILEREYDHFKPFLRAEGIRAVKDKGTWEFDGDGEKVTPLMGHDDCAYSIMDNGIARCGIENAFQSERTGFQKPVSCHLYPVRVTKVGENIALNYHRWDVCKPAVRLGEEYNLPVFRFLKDALTRVFGAQFYDELETAYAHWKKQQ